MNDPTTMIAGDRGAPNLAVDIVPDLAANTFVLDVSDVGGLDLLGWANGDDAWTNIVCDVTSVRTHRGATRLQGVLTRTEAGTLSLTLRDTDRRFDPTVNGEVIHPGTPLRVRAWGYTGEALQAQVDGGGAFPTVSTVLDGGTASGTGSESVSGGGAVNGTYWSETLFTGRIGSGDDAITVAYQKVGPPIVTIQAVDRVGPLASWGATGYPDPGVGGGDDLLQRAGRVITELGWDPSVISPDVDTTYAATLAAHVLDAAWDPLNACVDAELGRLWVDRDDRIVTRARNSELSGTVRGTLSDIHDEITLGAVHCCYDDTEVVYGTELLVNRAIGGRRIPRTDDDTSVPTTVVQVDDDYSQGRYGLAKIDQRSLELETDDQLLPWAQALVLDGTEPELRVNSVSVAPRNAPEAWPQIAATDIGDRWAFRFHPEVGPQVAVTIGVLGIDHDITPSRWTCEWLTEAAPTPGDNNPSGWFTADLSELDAGDLLAPIGGTVTVR